jgi:arylsulfatase A-like enzyme
MSPKLPNIILMVLDTVGAKHLSLYGYDRPTTPNLERIAQETSVFTRCVAPACWTVPSHASLFTGLYPSQHGAFENNVVLRDNLPHLVPILKAMGYATFGISANSLVSPASGLCPGFDEFHDLGFQDASPILAMLKGLEAEAPDGRGPLAARLQQTANGKKVVRAMLSYLWETGRARELFKTSWEMAAKQLRKWLKPRPIDNTTPYTRKTVRLIGDLLHRRASQNTPFFLLVNFLQAHQTYCPPRRWRRFSGFADRAWVSPQKFYFHRDSPELAGLVATYANLYDDEIRFLDEVVGRIWMLLRQFPRFEDTVVIITSDHGEHLGERGHYTHMLSLYNELLWVPLMIRFPRGLAAPGQDRRLASLNDLYATILDLADSPMPRPDTSFSLAAPPQRELAVSQCVDPDMWHPYLIAKQAAHRSRGQTFSPPVFAVTTDKGVKLIETRDGGLEVYHLKDSMIEGQNLASALPPEVLRNYRNLLEALKVETGFHEVVKDKPAPVSRQAA